VDKLRGCRPYGDAALSFVLPLPNLRSRGEVFPVVYVGFYMLQERQSPGLERHGGRSYAERLSRGSVRAAEMLRRGIYLSTAF